MHMLAQAQIEDLGLSNSLTELYGSILKPSQGSRGRGMGEHAHVQGTVGWVTGMCRMDHRSHVLGGEMPRACGVLTPKGAAPLPP